MASESEPAGDTDYGSAADMSWSGLSGDRRLNELLKSVTESVKGYAEDQIKHIMRLSQIGLALSSEKDINKLLELIVDEARAFSNADAGTLYILEGEREHLRFEIVQTESMDIRGGGTGPPLNMADVPLYGEGGEPNFSNVCSYVALKDETVNIPDVYEAEGFDFRGTRKYDESNNYRSKSMLVISMKNHENEIIGVLQLINALDPETGETIPFAPEYEDLIGSLASLAAVALTNRQLIEDLRNLLYAFIQSIATAIDEKSPYSGRHIDRVVELTMMIADRVNQVTEGPFQDVHLSDDELEELRLAAWMHDVGKITTPEYVVDKQTKLETIYDRIDLVGTRFHLIAKDLENEYLERKIERLTRQEGDVSGLDRLDGELAEKLAQLREEEEFVRSCNESVEFMSEDRIERIKEIAAKTYSLDGEEKPYLTENETQNLCVRKGSLTDAERDIINDHARMTQEVLQQLPFPKRLANVPAYAGAHHEKCDGSGYPNGLSGKDLPLQSRILAVADVFEALTARDRPYKEPMSLTEAVKIMGFMKKDRHIDPDIHDLFVSERIYYDYAVRKMGSDQIDVPGNEEAGT